MSDVFANMKQSNNVVLLRLALPSNGTDLKSR